MGKATLTKGQYSWLKFLQVNSNWTNEQIIEGYLKGKSVIKTEPVAGLSFDTLIKALLIGYEIEKPKFEIGDWVVGLRSGSLFKITGKIGVNFYGTCVKDGRTGLLIDGDIIRHATKEEIFWVELGRKVGEFVDGDALLDDGGTTQYVKAESKFSDNWISIAEAKEWYKDGDYIGFYPSESFKSFPTGDES